MGPALTSLIPGRELHKPRWPLALQNAALPLLCAYYTSFAELPGTLTPIRQLAPVMGLSEADVRGLAEVWHEAPKGALNVWELLAALAVTSGALSSRTKLAFIFRVWDENKDHKLQRAEVALLIRACLRGMGRYFAWPPTSQPPLTAIQSYVKKHFPTETYEEDFMKWSFGEPLFKAVLKVLTSRRVDHLDNLDFAFKQPLTSRRNAGSSPPDGPHGGLGEVVAPATTTLPAIRESLQLARAQRAEKPASIEAALLEHQVEQSAALPPIREELKNRRPAILKNMPINIKDVGAARGKLTLADAKAAWADTKFTCPLHGSKESECMFFTKHEVCLANRLWHFISECREVKFDSVWGLIHMLEREMAKDDSLLAQAQHRHIFKLSNTAGNPLFGMCIRQIHTGVDVTFREFLRALCPCASGPRLDLYEHWHSDNWSHEQAFVRSVKQWRKDSMAHWTKKTVTARRRLELQVQMNSMDTDGDLVLSIRDLVHGAAMTPDMARDIMAKYDVNDDKVLNANEFLAMMCPEDMRAKSDPALERLLKAKFDCIYDSWKSGQQATPPIESPALMQQAFEGLDENGDGVVTLDELIGHLDLHTAFGLMEVYDEDRDGNLTLEEFESLVQPEPFA